MRMVCLLQSLPDMNKLIHNQINLLCVCGWCQIVDYGDLSYLLEAEYERQLVALSQDAELLSLPLGTRSLAQGKVGYPPAASPCPCCPAYHTAVSMALSLQGCSSSPGVWYSVQCVMQLVIHQMQLLGSQGF